MYVGDISHMGLEIQILYIHEHQLTTGIYGMYTHYNMFMLQYICEDITRVTGDVYWYLI